MGKLAYYGLPVFIIVSAVLLIVFYHDYQHWVALHTGSLNTDGTPPNYNYWSGFGSVFPWEVGFFAGVWAGVLQRSRRATCHQHGCWRAGNYPVGSYRVCKKHHMEVTGSHPTTEWLQGHYQSMSGAGNGGPGEDTCGDSGSGSGEHGAGPVNVS